MDKTSLRLGALGLAAVEVSDIPPSAAKTKPFANQQSSVGIHQSNRKSRKQTRNVRIDTGRSNQTLRQSASISRHSSIQSREPQANQKRPHRHRALKPNPSPISKHQSPFIHPIERAASKPETSASTQGAQTKPFANQQASVAIHPSNRKSRKQTRNVRIDTGALKPNPSPISKHQSPFIHPIERAASKPETPASTQGAQTKPFANQQSSVGIHQSNRESRKQTRNVRIDTGRSNQTLRQSASISRHSSIQSREPQANQKRPHRHRALKPNPSQISKHQSPFINPIERAASKPETSTSAQGARTNPFANETSLRGVFASGLFLGQSATRGRLSLGPFGQ